MKDAANKGAAARADAEKKKGEEAIRAQERAEEEAKEREQAAARSDGARTIQRGVRARQGHSTRVVSRARFLFFSFSGNWKFPGRAGAKFSPSEVIRPTGRTKRTQI